MAVRGLRMLPDEAFRRSGSPCPREGQQGSHGDAVVLAHQPQCNGNPQAQLGLGAAKPSTACGTDGTPYQLPAEAMQHLARIFGFVPRQAPQSAMHASHLAASPQQQQQHDPTEAHTRPPLHPPAPSVQLSRKQAHASSPMDPALEHGQRQPRAQGRLHPSQAAPTECASTFPYRQQPQYRHQLDRQRLGALVSHAAPLPENALGIAKIQPRVQPAGAVMSGKGTGTATAAATAQRRATPGFPVQELKRAARWPGVSRAAQARARLAAQQCWGSAPDQQAQQAHAHTLQQQGPTHACTQGLPPAQPAQQNRLPSRSSAVTEPLDAEDARKLKALAALLQQSGRLPQQGNPAVDEEAQVHPVQPGAVPAVLRQTGLLRQPAEGAPRGRPHAPQQALPGVYGRQFAQHSEAPHSTAPAPCIASYAFADGHGIAVHAGGFRELADHPAKRVRHIEQTTVLQPMPQLAPPQPPQHSQQAQQDPADLLKSLLDPTFIAENPAQALQALIAIAQGYVAANSANWAGERPAASVSHHAAVAAPPAATDLPPTSAFPDSAAGQGHVMSSARSAPVAAPEAFADVSGFLPLDTTALIRAAQQLPAMTAQQSQELAQQQAQQLAQQAQDVAQRAQQAAHDARQAVLLSRTDLRRRRYVEPAEAAQLGRDSVHPSDRPRHHPSRARPRAGPDAPLPQQAAVVPPARSRAVTQSQDYLSTAAAARFQHPAQHSTSHESSSLHEQGLPQPHGAAGRRASDTAQHTAGPADAAAATVNPPGLSPEHARLLAAINSGQYGDPRNLTPAWLALLGNSAAGAAFAGPPAQVGAAAVRGPAGQGTLSPPKPSARRAHGAPSRRGSTTSSITVAHQQPIEPLANVHAGLGSAADYSRYDGAGVSHAVELPVGSQHAEYAASLSPNKRPYISGGEAAVRHAADARPGKRQRSGAGQSAHGAQAGLPLPVAVPVKRRRSVLTRLPRQQPWQQGLQREPQHPPQAQQHSVPLQHHHFSHDRSPRAEPSARPAANAQEPLDEAAMLLLELADQAGRQDQRPDERATQHANTQRSQHAQHDTHGQDVDSQSASETTLSLSHSSELQAEVAAGGAEGSSRLRAKAARRGGHPGERLKQGSRRTGTGCAAGRPPAHGVDVQAAAAALAASISALTGAQHATQHALPPWQDWSRVGIASTNDVAEGWPQGRRPQQDGEPNTMQGMPPGRSARQMGGFDAEPLSEVVQGGPPKLSRFAHGGRHAQASPSP